ncbi:hypothetical protein ACFY97_02345 [Streptomyces klenkii]|uniref:hypothetical protein n=1 Tax=Streptomyces klenkii TaxID=1420899 RepID=UPI0036E9E21C
MRLRHTAVGALVTGLVLIAAPTAPAGAAAPADPPGCTRTGLPSGGVHIVCAQGVPVDTTLNGTGKADIIEVRGGDAATGHLSGTVNGLGGDDVIVVDRILGNGGGRHIPGVIDGGDGDDKITVTDKDDWPVLGLIYGGAGNDTITVAELGGPLHGGPGDDEIAVYGFALVNSRTPKTATVEGDEGDDVIRVGATGATDNVRTTHVSGGAGADLIEVPSVGQGRGATVSGDDDDDVIQGPGGTAVAVGPYGTVDGGRGDNLCRTDNRDGGTVTNCRA